MKEAPRKCQFCSGPLGKHDDLMCIACFTRRYPISVDCLLRSADPPFRIARRPRRGPPRWWRGQMGSKEYGQEEAVKIARDEKHNKESAHV